MPAWAIAVWNNVKIIAFKAYGYLLSIAIGLLVLLAINTALTLYSPIARPKIELSERDCYLGSLPNLWKYTKHDKLAMPKGMHDVIGWDYDREAVANQFVTFAALSSNSYDKEGEFRFDLASLSGGWIYRNRISTAGGLVMDTLHRRLADRVEIAFVFRGTEPSSIGDLLSNASWFVSNFNPFDQYRAAREAVSKQRQALAADGTISPRDKYSFVSVGHSLGGGLAKHVSAAFHCTNAVVFNPSFVANRHQFGRPHSNVIVEIFENDDWLNRLVHSFHAPQTNQLTTLWQWYRMNNNETESKAHEHSMLRATLAMSRMALCCRHRALNGGLCSINDSNDASTQVWCKAASTDLFRSPEDARKLCRFEPNNPAARYC